MESKKKSASRSGPFSSSFREQVARDYLSSESSIAEITKKYGLASVLTTRNWVAAYRKKSDIEAIPLSPMTEKEKQNLRALKKRVSELEKQLKYERLRTLAFETLIDVAEEELNVEIRKKPGTKQSTD